MKNNPLTTVTLFLITIAVILKVWAALSYGKAAHWETHLASGLLTVSGFLLLSKRFEQEPFLDRWFPWTIPYNLFWRTTIILGFVGLAVVTTCLGLGAIMLWVYSGTSLVVLRLGFGIEW